MTGNGDLKFAKCSKLRIQLLELETVSRLSNSGINDSILESTVWLDRPKRDRFCRGFCLTYKEGIAE